MSAIFKGQSSGEEMKVVQCFYRLAASGCDYQRLSEALPDRRLLYPVGDIDFPGRQFHRGNYHDLVPALESSGVR